MLLNRQDTQHPAVLSATGKEGIYTFLTSLYIKGWFHENRPGPKLQDAALAGALWADDAPAQ